MLTDFMTYFDVTDVFSCSIKLHSPGHFRMSSEWPEHCPNTSQTNLVPGLLSTLPVPSRCERTLVLSGHVIRARLPYEVGVGRLITFVSKCFEIVTVLFH